VLQCGTVCCSVLQYVAVCCSLLQFVAVCRSLLQSVAVWYSVLQCVAVRCSPLQSVAVCCGVRHSASVGSCGKEASSCSPLSQLSPDYLGSACVLRYVAVCCSVLQCVGLFPNCLLTIWGLHVCCSVLQCKKMKFTFTANVNRLE